MSSQQLPLYPKLSNVKLLKQNHQAYFHIDNPLFNHNSQNKQSKKPASKTKSRLLKLKQQNNSKKDQNQGLPPVMFQFQQPKAGFYALKGCKMQNNQQDKQNNNGRARGKSQFLCYFLKRCCKNRESNQTSCYELPSIKQNLPYVYPSMDQDIIKPTPFQTYSMNNLPKCPSNINAKLKSYNLQKCKQKYRQKSKNMEEFRNNNRSCNILEEIFKQN